MEVKVIGKRYLVGSLAQAVEMVDIIRENSNMGVSEMGSDFPVTDEGGTTVALISYNGRAWTNAPYGQRTEILA